MFGWQGKILRIDLSRGTWRTEALPAYLMQEYIGGRGMSDRILFDEIDPRIDALSPENKLIFSTGPLTGSGVRHVPALRRKRFHAKRAKTAKARDAR